MKTSRLNQTQRHLEMRKLIESIQPYRDFIVVKKTSKVLTLEDLEKIKITSFKSQSK